MCDITLIAMPYAAVERPSLALGLLKAGLTRQGFSATVCYANLLFAEEIGLSNYFFLSNNLPRLMMGEWTFAGAAFPEFQPDHTSYLQECQQWRVGAKFLQNIRDKVPTFIDRMTERILADNPKIVGCSSMFQQHCASLAVLKRIKTLRPEVITMLGGANCEGTMGRVTHQCFEWVDYVISGEADECLPELCRLLRSNERNRHPEKMPTGVYAPVSRQNGVMPQIARAVVTDLDALPTPVYDEYFKTLQTSTLAHRIKPGLVFETSRGCWWGQQRQCAFCGLSDSSRRFRAKSAPRVLAEVDALSQKYQNYKFMATDSSLNLKYTETALPELARRKGPQLFFFETLAGLSQKQVKQMAEAGIRWLQPGIESLHDRILTLLNKGTRAWKNVQMLKWCMQHGVFVSWNCLGNVPGDEAAWYREMLDWWPLIAHLQPPMTLWLIRYDRFSQYQQDPERFHLHLKPLRAYSAIYPLSAEHLWDFAYYFDDVSPQPDDVQQEKTCIFQLLLQQIDIWQKAFYVSRPDILKKEVSPNRPILTMRDIDDGLRITDTRPCATQTEMMLQGIAREVYLACDAAPTEVRLLQQFQQQGRRLAWTDIQPLVEQLLAQKILLRLHDRLISLAICEPLAPILTFDDDPCGLVMLPRTKPL